MNEIYATSDQKDVPLWVLLLHASQAIEVKLELALANSGLSLAKLSVLSHLVEAGEPLSLSRLAARLSCVKSNITQLVDRLESDSLVERISDPEDRRSIKAAITKEGRRRYDLGGQALADQEKELFKALKKAEKEMLADFLKKLSKS
jgi:DNA-binding MarR family transcriptional regulator